MRTRAELCVQLCTGEVGQSKGKESEILYGRKQKEAVVKSEETV